VRLRKRWLWVTGFILLGVVLTPSYVRAYRVGGSSDAPTYMLGDLVFMNRAAYDIRLPYTDIVLLSHSQPGRGDVVMYSIPGADHTVFKRVVGCPTDVLEMRDNRLAVNGTALKYKEAGAEVDETVARKNSLGSIIEIESGNGPSHPIAHSPDGGPYASFGPVDVPEDHYFLVGDNRDNSMDSRAYGPVPRERILGKLSGVYGR
jgi:signal peptidase I